MPIINRISEYHNDMKAWRQHLHETPELQFDCHKTAAFVVERLREFGVDEIHEGVIARQIGVLDPEAREMPGHTLGNKAQTIIFDAGICGRNNDADPAPLADPGFLRLGLGLCDIHRLLSILYRHHDRHYPISGTAETGTVAAFCLRPHARFGFGP